MPKCLTEGLDIQISLKHQRMLKDMDIRCKRSKPELKHEYNYYEARKQLNNYKQIQSTLEKRKEC